MPQVLIVLAAGAAAYAGYRWYQKQIERHDTETRRAEAEARRRAAEAVGPGGDAKDLGQLEWDDSTGAYRPKRVN